LSPEEGEELAQKTFEVYKKLAGVQVGALNEEEVLEEGIMSFEEYRSMIMGLLPNKENIKRRFDEFNDRMNQY
jgi:uncharacterized protein YfkK (UPF0435 family)